MRLLDCRPIHKGKVLAATRLELPFGLRINDVLIFAGKDGRPFATLPAKPLLDRERRQRIGPDGRALYTPILEWCDRELGSRFSDTVVALVLEAHPEVFAEPKDRSTS
jgi:hypothetical protein